MSLEAVAKRARASKATIYRWWPTRVHLLAEIYLRKNPPAPMRAGTLEEVCVAFLPALSMHWQESRVFLSIIAESQRDSVGVTVLESLLNSSALALSDVCSKRDASGELAIVGATNLAAELLLGLVLYRLLLGRPVLEEDDARSIVRIVLGPETQ